MRPAQMTENENTIIQSILMVEISMAIRSMGNAKDYNALEIKLFSSQVLDGFMVRSKTVSFASMLLFFKMRRARLAPCNKNTYGFNPTAILDELNEFLDWQRDQFAEHSAKNTKGHLSLAQRSDSLAKTLHNAPQYIQNSFYELSIRLQEKARQEKERPVKTMYNKDMQQKRLMNCMEMAYLEMGLTKAEGQQKAIELLKAWGEIDGNGLKAKIDELFPPMETSKKDAVQVGFENSDGSGKTIISFKGYNGRHKINSDK